MFFGTPEWAVPSLEALIASDIDVVGVVTNLDKPAGRGLTERAPPVKLAAADSGLPILQVKSARDDALLSFLRDTEADVATVVAYGKLLPAALLELPPLGFVNVHFSLLPQYRGAAPVQRALMDGVSETGVSIMVLTEGMDEGPVLARRRESVAPEDTAGTVGPRLARIGAELLVETLPRYHAGEIQPEEQDHRAATYAPRITNEETQIDWNRTARAIRDHVRALDPNPSAWTSIDGRRLKVFGVAPATESLATGSIGIADGLVTVGAADGSLALTEVQPAGKRRMSGADFARGVRLPAGARVDV